MSLLMDSNTILLKPKLAVKIGINEAIVVQQVHYWLERSNHDYDGKKWVFNSLDKWCEQFPFWSKRT
ncbi:replication protein, partial [Bacillus cereus]